MAQVDWVKGRLAQEQVKQRRVVGLNDEEEDFLERNVEQLRANDNIVRVGPDARSNQIRVPRCCGHDGDLEKNERGLVED